MQVTLAKAELRDATIAQKDKSIEMLRMKKTELQAQFDELSSSCLLYTSSTIPLKYVPRILSTTVFLS